MRTPTKSSIDSPAVRWAVIAAIGAVLFFASYRFAVAQAPQNQISAPSPTAAKAGSASTGPSGGGCCSGSAAGSTVASGGGGCCGGGAAGPAITKSASVQGGVQTVSVDLSKGYYDPSTIQLKAGVPAEITFGRGSGCLGAVRSQQLGFGEDLTGGPKTIKLAGLQPGTYKFTCGMGMVSGSIIVR